MSDIIDAYTSYEAFLQTALQDVSALRHSATTMHLRGLAAETFPQHFRNAAGVNAAYYHMLGGVHVGLMNNILTLQAEEYTLRFISYAAKGVLTRWVNQTVPGSPLPKVYEHAPTTLDIPDYDITGVRERLVYLKDREAYEKKHHPGAALREKQDLSEEQQERQEGAYYIEALTHGDEDIADQLDNICTRYVHIRNNTVKNLAALYLNDATLLLTRASIDIAAFVAMNKSDAKSLCLIEDQIADAQESAHRAGELLPELAFIELPEISEPTYFSKSGVPLIPLKNQP